MAQQERFGEIVYTCDYVRLKSRSRYYHSGNRTCGELAIPVQLVDAKPHAAYCPKPYLSSIKWVITTL